MIDMIKRLSLIALMLAAAAGAVAAEQQAAPAASPAPTVLRKQVLSQTYTVDRQYRSMEGPGSVQKIYLGDPDSPELLWITGVHTEMVGEDGSTPQLPELMCHVNIDLDAARHQALFNLTRPTATRLVTLSQGMLDATLPPGFGFPIASNEPLTLFTQVLNHNIEHPKNLKVRHRVTFEYVRDRDLKTPMKPLFNVGASGMVLLNNNPLALTTSMTTPSTPAGAPESAHHDHHAMTTGAASAASTSDGSAPGASCLIGSRAPNANGAGADYVDPLGRKMTGHWVVPPGKQVNASDITWFMNLPYDTRLHYAAAHLHPFAKALIIKDTTTGETVFQAKAEGPEKGVGLSHVDTFTSLDGVPMYKDHKYELISEYDNPTSENHDSMASAFLGLEDPEFVRPDSVVLSARGAEFLYNSPNLAVAVRTTVGDFAVSLLREDSPEAVKQFLRLARVGAFDHMRVVRVTNNTIETIGGAPTAQLRAVMKPVLVEPTAKHEPGTLSLCPGDTAFAIVFAVGSDRDGRCTAVGRIGPGSEVIRTIASTARDTAGTPTDAIEIAKVDVYDMASSGKAFQLAPAKTVASK